MEAVLWLLLIQGMLGAFDTIYFHELVAKLPICPEAAPELKLHALRDFVYTVIFATLPFFECRGLFAAAVISLLGLELLLTLTDFIVEDSIRRVRAGERVTHALIGVNYGAILAVSSPILISWFQLPTALVRVSYRLPGVLLFLLAVISLGLLLSGGRDLCCGLGFRRFAWPWK